MIQTNITKYALEATNTATRTAGNEFSNQDESLFMAMISERSVDSEDDKEPCLSENSSDVLVTDPSLSMQFNPAMECTTRAVNGFSSQATSKNAYPAFLGQLSLLVNFAQPMLSSGNPVSSSDDAAAMEDVLPHIADHFCSSNGATAGIEIDKNADGHQNVMDEDAGSRSELNHYGERKQTDRSVVNTMAGLVESFDSEMFDPESPVMNTDEIKLGSSPSPLVLFSSPTTQIVSRIHDETSRRNGTVTETGEKVFDDDKITIQPGAHRIFKLNLIPEDLGEVQITLRRTLSGLRVHIEVEKVSTANVLQADISTLTEKLSGSSQGLTTTVINIEVRDDIEYAARSSQLEANLYGGPGTFSGSMSGMNKRSNPDKQELAFPSMSRREDDNEPQSRSAILGVVV